MDAAVGSSGPSLVYSILRTRPEPLKSLDTHRKGLPFVNVLFYACDRGLLIVYLRTAFVHFAAFNIIFPRFFLNSWEFGKTEKTGARAFRMGIWEGGGLREAFVTWLRGE